MTKIAPYAKAAIGAIVAGLASAQQALDDGTISSAEGVGIAAAVFAGLVLVFSVPNRDPQAEHQAESVQPPERGDVPVVTVLVVVLLVLLILFLVGAIR